MNIYRTMSSALYDACLLNALIRKENELQKQIIRKLKAQQKSKSHVKKTYYEKDIVMLTTRLDDVYTSLQEHKH